MLNRARLRKDLEYFGVWRTFSWRLGSAAARFLGIHAYVVMARGTAELPALDELPEGLELVDLNLEQASEAAVNQPELDLSPGFVEAAMARGDRCRAAVRDGTVLGYVWLSTNGCTPHEDYVAKTYPPDSFYSGTAFVTPAARGNHLMVILNRSNLELMAARGYETELGTMAVHNLSTRGHRKHAWTLRNLDGSRSHEIGYAGYVRWGTRVWCVRSPAVRDIGFGFAPTRAKAPR